MSLEEPDNSHLLLVRLWTYDQVGPNNGAEAPVMGKVQHILTDRAQSFQSWEGLLDLLRQMISTARPHPIDQPGQSPDYSTEGDTQ